MYLANLPAILPAMSKAMTTTERRRNDRERKRRQRAAARAAGVPSSAEVARAIVEAVSFATLTADLDAWDRAAGWSPVNVGLIVEVAIDILVDRCHFDRRHSRAAVKAALVPRAEHGWPSSLPSTCPGPDGKRYAVRAPGSATRPRRR